MDYSLSVLTPSPTVASVYMFGIIIIILYTISRIVNSTTIYYLLLVYGIRFISY
jgi:hypothetical protein